MGRRVTVLFAEPTGGPFRERYTGTVRRVLFRKGQPRLSFHYAIVELDRALEWEDRTLNHVSFMARSRGSELPDIFSKPFLWANFLLAPEWSLTCPEDDPRLANVQTFYIGFGRVNLGGEGAGASAPADRGTRASTT